MKFEQDLFSLDNLDVSVYNVHLDKFKAFCDDFRSFNNRKFDLLKVIVDDYQERNIPNCAAL